MPRSVGLVRCSFVFLYLTLTGCSTLGQLDGPPDWCKQPSTKIVCKEGGDLVQCYKELKQENAREKSKRRCLQRYARAVSG